MNNKEKNLNFSFNLNANERYRKENKKSIKIFIKMIKHVKDKTIISLNPEEYYKLQEILIDEDKEKALSFIKNVLGKKIKEIERPKCVPVFEASYRPGQKDEFKNKP